MLQLHHFNKYRSNIGAIRKNIGVAPNTVNGKLNGFMLEKVAILTNLELK